MADYRDLGKVADDLFGKGTRKDAQKPGTEQEKIHPNPDEPEVFPDIRPQEDAPEPGRDEFSSGIERTYRCPGRKQEVCGQFSVQYAFQAGSGCGTDDRRTGRFSFAACCLGRQR